jgi:hypothetical protein
MQSAIRSTSRSAAQSSVIGYLCMLVLLVFAIGLLALQAPASTASSAPVRLTGSPALYQIDGQQGSYVGSYGD